MGFHMVIKACQMDIGVIQEKMLTMSQLARIYLGKIGVEQCC